MPEDITEMVRRLARPRLTVRKKRARSLKGWRTRKRMGEARKAAQGTEAKPHG